MPLYGFTAHSRERILERGIDLVQLPLVVTAPDIAIFQCKGIHGGDVYKYTKDIGGKVLVVVAKTDGPRFLFITAYWKS